MATWARACAVLLTLMGVAAPSRPALTSTAAHADERVELHLWNIPTKGSANPVYAARRKVFDAFCMRHPEIKVTALVPLKIDGPAAEGNEFMAVAGGVAPDVFYLYGRKIGDYRTQGFLYPLNDYLAGYAREHGKPYSGISAPDKVWELCQDRGKILAVPYLYYSMVLMCNKGIFAKGGLAGRAPRDWDELYTMARHLTRDPTKEPGAKPDEPMQYGLCMMTGLIAGWPYLQYVWSSGGEVVQPYYRRNGELKAVPPPLVDYHKCHIRLGNEQLYYRERRKLQSDLARRAIPTTYGMDDLEWRLETNKPDSIRAFYFYRKLVHQPWLRNGDHEFDITPGMYKKRKAVDPVTGKVFNLDAPAVKKRIYYGVTNAAAAQAGTNKLERATYAMMVIDSDDAYDNDLSEYTIAPFPSRKGFPPAIFMAGHYVAINSAITAEDKPGRRNVQAIRDAAWKYIEFVTGPEAQKITADTFVEAGLVEYLRPSLLEETGYSDLVSRIPPGVRDLWANLQGHAKIEPYCKGFTHVMTRELGMAIEQVVNDRPDPTTGAFRRNPQAIMDETVRNVNTMILGKMPESEVERRSRIGWVIFVVMMAALALGAQRVVRLAMRGQAKTGDNEGFGVGGHPARRRLYAWVFLTPAVATIAIWAYYPLARGLLMAFQDYKILGGSSYVGLRNFVEAVSEPKFWKYLLQSFEYMAISVGIGFLVPIALAILLTEIPKGKVLYRTIYYLPAVTTGLVTLFLWKGLMYDPSNSGIINQLILWFNSWPLALVVIAKLAVALGFGAIAAGLIAQAFHQHNSRGMRMLSGAIGGLLAVALAWVIGANLLGGTPAQALVSKFNFQAQSFLQDPSLAMLWVVIPTIWAGAGPGCLIYLAALKGIPDEQYEAADLDGAGIWQKILTVTYPNLKALIIISLVGAVVGGVKESGNIFVMTGGGPEDATMTSGLYIWYNAFMFLNFGLSTAMAWILGALLIGFTLKQLQILNNIQFKSTAVDEEARGGKA